jgi:hypothetical protein
VGHRRQYVLGIDSCSPCIVRMTDSSPLIVANHPPACTLCVALMHCGACCRLESALIGSCDVMMIPVRQTYCVHSMNAGGAFGVGARVRVICENPAKGWGSVNRFDEGTITKISGDDVDVDFTAQKGWSGKLREFELVSVGMFSSQS